MQNFISFDAMLYIVFLILESNSEFVSISIRALMQTRIVWLYMSLTMRWMT